MCTQQQAFAISMTDPIYTELESYGTISIAGTPEPEENSDSKSSMRDKKWWLLPLIVVIIIIIGVCVLTWTIESATNKSYYEYEINHDLKAIDQSNQDSSPN